MYARVRVCECVCVCVCVSSPRVVPGKGLLEGPHWLAVGAQYTTLNVVERVHSTTNDVADLVEELQQNKPRQQSTLVCTCRTRTCQRNRIIIMF